MNRKDIENKTLIIMISKQWPVNFGFVEYFKQSWKNWTNNLPDLEIYNGSGASLLVVVHEKY